MFVSCLGTKLKIYNCEQKFAGKPPLRLSSRSKTSFVSNVNLFSFTACIAKRCGKWKRRESNRKPQCSIVRSLNLFSMRFSKKKLLCVERTSAEWIYCEITIKTIYYGVSITHFFPRIIFGSPNSCGSFFVKEICYLKLYNFHRRGSWQHLKGNSRLEPSFIRMKSGESWLSSKGFFGFVLFDSL